MRYRLSVAYDGTSFAGWQVQRNGLAIQQLICDALTQILGHEIALCGSGRTDAGVHALGQVAHFDTDRDTTRLAYALNCLLPPTVRILSLTATEPTFHARYSAKAKIYQYRLCLSAIQLPWRRHYALHLDRRFNRALLESARAPFIGTHDFTAFANSPTQGSVTKGGVRTIYRIDLLEEDDELVLEFEGNGFLYKMVRNLVGTMLEVANGQRELSDLSAILASCDRRRAGQAAPPHGLYLKEVLY